MWNYYTAFSYTEISAVLWQRHCPVLMWPLIANRRYSNNYDVYEHHKCRITASSPRVTRAHGVNTEWPRILRQRKYLVCVTLWDPHIFRYFYEYTIYEIELKRLVQHYLTVWWLCSFIPYNAIAISEISRYHQINVPWFAHLNNKLAFSPRIPLNHRLLTVRFLLLHFHIAS